MCSPLPDVANMHNHRPLCNGTHNLEAGLSAENGPSTKARFSIDTLPDVELGYIFNYLHWKDKLRLLKAVPQVWRVINSPLGWQTFRSGERQTAENQHEELACVLEYGHLFQHCTLWLGRPCRNTWECTCLFDNLNTDNIFPVLEAVVDKCRVLKSLRLYHPSHVTPDSDDTHIFKQYQQAIEKLLLYALQRNRFSLELCGLQYSHDHIRPIWLRFLDYYISNPQVLGLVQVLDITGVTDSRFQSHNRLACLEHMLQLTTLKVPIHCITMTILQSLVQHKMENLYLLSDDYTVDLEFKFTERKHLHWDQLLVPRNKDFSVHYVFKQRVLKCDDLTPNPYVKSVCLDSLCNPVSEDLVMCIAENYHKSLQLFCFTQTVWKLDLRLSDLSQFAAKCQQLIYFLSTLSLPGSLLLTLVKNAPSLRQVLIVASQDGELQELAEVKSTMSQCLGQKWAPHMSPSTFHVVNCELVFLIDPYLLHGFGQ